MQNTSRVNFPDRDGDPQHVRAAAPDRPSHHDSCGIRCSSRRIGIGSSPSTIRSGVPELPEVKEFGADIAAEQAFHRAERTLVAAGSAGRFSTASVPDAVAPTILTGTEVHLSADAGNCPCRRSASPLGQDLSPTTAEAFTAWPHALTGRAAAFRPGAGGESRAPESRKCGGIPLAPSGLSGLPGWNFPGGTSPDEHPGRTPPSTLGSPEPPGQVPHELHGRRTSCPLNQPSSEAECGANRAQDPRDPDPVERRTNRGAERRSSRGPAGVDDQPCRRPRPAKRSPARRSGARMPHNCCPVQFLPQEPSGMRCSAHRSGRMRSPTVQRNAAGGKCGIGRRARSTAFDGPEPDRAEPGRTQNAGPQNAAPQNAATRHADPRRTRRLSRFPRIPSRCPR